MTYDDFRVWFEEATGYSRDEILAMLEERDWDALPLTVKKLFVAVAMAAENVAWHED